MLLGFVFLKMGWNGFGAQGHPQTPSGPLNVIFPKNEKRKTFQKTKKTKRFPTLVSCLSSKTFTFSLIITTKTIVYYFKHIIQNPTSQPKFPQKYYDVIMEHQMKSKLINDVTSFCIGILTILYIIAYGLISFKTILLIQVIMVGIAMLIDSLVFFIKQKICPNQVASENYSNNDTITILVGNEIFYENRTFLCQVSQYFHSYCNICPHHTILPPLDLSHKDSKEWILFKQFLLYLNNDTSTNEMEFIVTDDTDNGNNDNDTEITNNELEILLTWCNDFRLDRGVTLCQAIKLLKEIKGLDLSLTEEDEITREEFYNFQEHLPQILHILKLCMEYNFQHLKDSLLCFFRRLLKRSYQEVWILIENIEPRLRHEIWDSIEQNKNVATEKYGVPESLPEYVWKSMVLRSPCRGFVRTNTMAMMMKKTPRL